MNPRHDEAPAPSAIAVDSLATVRMDHPRLADLAFGSFSRTHATGANFSRPLALLTSDSLELDLTDPAQRNFGNYELLEWIGEGGMGVVYRARQHGLDRDVAVKLLAAGPWASHEYIERFQCEAQNAARMQHPNIVPIYEVGNSEEIHFFSMGLIRGGSLSDLLRREGRLEPRRAAQLLRTIAEAVEYAHRLGVLHLDLKPANVLLDMRGEPHVADFGLARQFHHGLEADNHEISGTPSYMAPEQATAGAQRITPATDIWGLGAIGYELVTGRPPFLGTTPQDTLKRVVEGELTNPRAYVAILPLDLVAIIGKCMARQVPERYASARDLADDLARFIEGREVRARPLNVFQRQARWARREPKLAATAILALAALLAGTIATTQQWRRADANAVRAQASAAQANDRLWKDRRDTASRLMNDGKGFEALAPLIDNIDEQERAGRVDPSTIERREIGMIEAQGAILIDRMIIPDAPPLATALSPDGNLLAIGLGDLSVRWYDTATLTERGRVDVSGMPTSDGEERAPRLLRFVDNHRLRVTLEWFDYLASPSDDDTYIVDLDAAKVVGMPSQFAQPADATYSADARHALLRNRQGDMQLWQVEPWKALSPLVPSPLRGGVWQAFVGNDARFVAEKLEDFNGFMTLLDPRTLSPAHPSGLQAALTAWAENPAGTLLSLGDARGRMYLLDLTTHALRQLPTPSGREVTWTGFSEDGEWMAATRWDGMTFAFDAASGNSLNSGQMADEFEPHEVAIRHNEHLLSVSGLGTTALWRLPSEGPNAMEATRLIASPTRSPRAGTNATAMALGSRLLATADLDGEVRLWRIAAPPSRFPHPALDTNAADGNLHFDGKHILDIAYKAVRVATIDGRTATAWVWLPQPVGTCALVDSGRRALVSSGRSLRVFDVGAELNLRRVVELPANPLRMATNADGSLALLTFGTNGPAGFNERIVAYDTRTGAERASVYVRGPLRQFELSPDGARLLTVGPADGATIVFDAATLRESASHPHDPQRPVLWGAFVPQTDMLWLLARDADDTIANDADLVAWNTRSGAIGERRHIPGVFAVGVAAIGGKPLLATRERDVFDAGGGAEISAVSTDLHADSTSVFAYSHDGRLVAHVLGRDVQLYDAATFAPVGPPLHSNLGYLDFPRRLAFSPDDRYLLGEAQTSWLIWPIAADMRPIAQLHAMAQLLVPAQRAGHLMAFPDAAQRRALRRADPGPPPTARPRPELRSARVVRGIPIPQRDPGLDPLLLDLTNNYNRPGDLIADMDSSVSPGEIGMRMGVARIDGVDYDMRGGIELRPHGSHYAKVDGIRVPDIAIASFRVLLLAPSAAPSGDARDYASVRLHYRDGSEAVVPIHTRGDVPGMSGDDATTRVGWVRGDALRLLGLWRQALMSSAQLGNPHPEKRIASLDLEEDGTNNPVFLAITAEPVTATAESGN